MPRRLQRGIVGHEFDCVLAGLFEEIAIGNGVGVTKFTQAVLARAEELAGTAQSSVFFREDEAVVGAGERLQPQACLFVGQPREEKTFPGDRTSTDPPAKLVQLRKTETLGMFNQ